MTTAAGVVCMAQVGLVALLVYRLAVGPTVADRIVALNAMATQATIAVMFFAVVEDRSIYLDVSLWLSSFSYLGTIVWSRYLERGLL